MSNTDTEKRVPDIDSLLENKEQNDKAIAELVDSPREKLQRLEAVIPAPQTEPPQPKTSDAFELKLDSRLWQVLGHVFIFAVMFFFVWIAFALLKEPKTSGNTTPANIQVPMQLPNIPLETPAAYPDEPVEDFYALLLSSIITPLSTDGDEPVSSDILPPQPTEEVEDKPPVVEVVLTPTTVQRPRIRLFQRRL